MSKQDLLRKARAAGIETSKGGTALAPTRTAQTQERYVRRGLSLLARFVAAAGLEHDETPVSREFAEWLRDTIRPTLRPSAWRQYRAAAATVIEAMDDLSADAAIRIIGEPAEQGRQPRRTGARKRKRFPKDVFDRILVWLRRVSTSEVALIAADWVVAGLATGLRPGEWRAAMVEDCKLFVVNAKATNGRGNGEARTLDLAVVTDRTRGVIIRMTELGADWHRHGQYERRQRQVSHVLSRACMAATGQGGFTLYSLRHQFVATAKASLRPAEVSAAVGHCVTTTAIQAYGRRRSAWKPTDVRDVVLPVPDEVSTVRSPRPAGWMQVGM
ncbi:hypothetical protein ASG43_21480 [Aureimonas sp. Leaf454]|uniref:hypothetical protein n=1 Tax=Aureimonas sp. Leaf454 TaxID=1736381 RepID=UPI0006F41CEE|nr:hypothetical protein [Aureimonas sp. Leaf454]KQT51179.1 hypothetical protein ASG43_21480 [Aureimonas sp. Leaf454]